MKSPAQIKTQLNDLNTRLNKAIAKADRVALTDNVARWNDCNAKIDLLNAQIDMLLWCLGFND